nr:tetratricopeptide repeat protein [Ruminiclostridium josui]
MNRLGYTQKAIAYYNTSIEKNPRYPYSYLNLSLIYMEENDIEKAIEVISNGIRYNADASFCTTTELVFTFIRVS